MQFAYDLSAQQANLNVKMAHGILINGINCRYLRDRLEEVEHEGFSSRDGDHQKLPLHSRDVYVRLRGAVQSGPEHVLGVVQELYPLGSAVRVRHHGARACSA